MCELEISSFVTPDPLFLPGLCPPRLAIQTLSKVVLVLWLPVWPKGNTQQIKKGRNSEVRYFPHPGFSLRFSVAVSVS